MKYLINKLHHAFKYPEINKSLSIDDFRKAYKHAFELGLVLLSTMADGDGCEELTSQPRLLLID